MRISDWSSDVCSSDLCESLFSGDPATTKRQIGRLVGYMISNTMIQTRDYDHPLFYYEATMRTKALDLLTQLKRFIHARVIKSPQLQQTRFKGQQRSEEHPSELQSLMRSSYAVFCLKTKNNIYIN